MKYLIIIIALFFSTGAYAQHEGHRMPEKKEQTVTKKLYTCPMHSEVQSDKPGKCPKCGMNLEKKKVKVTVNKSAQSKPKTQTPVNMQQSMDEQMLHNDTASMHQHSMVKMQMADTLPPFAGKVIMQPGKTVRYDLYVNDTLVNYTGKQKHAFAVNGTLPGPDLVFTEGDTAEIYVHNLAKHETSIHWHGVILPNQFDGVPYLTTQPVHTGETHLYKFAVQQNGTYWYHSHSGLQEQAGVYGALIFEKRPEQRMDLAAMHQQTQMPTDTPTNKDHSMHNMQGPDMGGNHMQMMQMPAKGNSSYNREQTIVLSDWTDEKPSQVQRRLRTVNDWYAIEKGSTQSYSEAIFSGHFGTKVNNEWKRMNAMDM